MLWRHDRTRPRQAMGDALCQAIHRVFAAAEAAAPTEQDLHRVEAALRELREQGDWIACACGGLMYPRLRGGRMELVQHPTRPHVETCHLRRTRAIRIQPAARQDAPEPDPGQPWPDPAHPPHVLLRHLLHASEMDVLDPSSFTQVQRGGRPTVLATDLDAHYARFRATLEPTGRCAGSCQALQWIARRASGRRYWLLAVAHALDARGATLRDGRVDALMVSLQGSEHGPWAVLAGFEANTPPQRAVWLAAQSVYARGLLFPVQDARDRALLVLLAQQLSYWARQGIRVHLEAGEERGFRLCLPNGRRLRVCPSSTQATRIRADGEEIQAGADEHRLRRVLTALVLRACSETSCVS